MDELERAYAEETNSLFPLPSQIAKERFISFRRRWEKFHGPTDVRTPYMSQAPTNVQNWMIEHQPELFFEGLPPFVQDFFVLLVRTARKEKKMDRLPDLLTRLMKRNNGGLPQRPDLTYRTKK